MFLYKYLLRITSADIFNLNMISRWLGLLFIGVALNLGAISTTQAATNCKIVDKNTEIFETECAFLLHFYHRTGGVSWTHNDGWLENNEPCSWRGIDCDESGHVSKISLSGNNLSGMIPQLDDLPNLQVLDIDNYRLCKHPYNDYGDWQSEIDQFPDCNMVAAFDVSSDRGCIDFNPPSTFEVTLDATPSRNFNDEMIDYYRWTSNGQPLSGDSSIIKIDYEDIGEHKVGLVVEYGNPSTISNNDAQQLITVNECLYGLTVTIDGEGVGIVTDEQSLYCGRDNLSCSKNYSLNKWVTLHARPAANSEFTGWTGACLAEGTNPSCTISMAQKKTVGASFGVASHTVQVQINGEGTVSGSGTYKHGTEVTLAANPKENWYFAGWFGGGCSGTYSCLITLDRDIEDITATFKQDVRELTVNIEGDGTVVGVNCSSDCKKSYDYETEVTLIAIPQEGWTFKGWADDCSSITGNECTVTMNQPHQVTANFARIHTLSVEVKDSVGGIVRSDLDGIDNCSYHCENLYQHGTPVTLTAMPDDGYVLAMWSKNCQEKYRNACTVVMEQTQYVMATFVPEPQPILTVHVGIGGFVNSESSAITDCFGGTCNHNFGEKTKVTLIATPDEGYTFGHWSENCTVKDHVCTITIDQAKSVMATFVPAPEPILTLQVGIGGFVKSEPPVITDCFGGTCNHNFEQETDVILTAIPYEGYTFGNWSENCEVTDNQCTISIDKAKSVTATFVPNNTHILTVAKGNCSTVTSTDQEIFCGSDCKWRYSDGTKVTLTVVDKPEEHYNFRGWNVHVKDDGGNWVTNNEICPLNDISCTIFMESNTRVHAQCVEESPPVTITVYNNSIDKDKIGMGRISDGSGHTCEEPKCSTEYYYSAGTEICLTAQPDEFSKFVSWDDIDCDNDPKNCCIEIDKKQTITANWEKLPPCSYELSYASQTFEASGGDDSIRVVETINRADQQCISSPWSVTNNCDWLKTNEASNLLNYADILNYSVESNPDSDIRVCPLTIAENQFFVVQKSEQPPPPTTLRIIGSNYGSILGIENYKGQSDDTKYYDEPDVITLIAEPVDGASFERWRGDCSSNGSKPKCTIVMDQDRTVTADFGLDDINLNITVVGDGGVIVKRGKEDSECFGDCQIDLKKNEIIELTATTGADDYQFAGWLSEDCPDTNSCMIYMDESKAVTANFLPKNKVIACFDYKVLARQENPLVIEANASCSRNGKIAQYEWEASDNQSDSGQRVEIAFAEVKEYELTLTVIGENGTEDQVTKTIPFNNELSISGMKGNYRVGEKIEVDLIENIEKSNRFERVALWVVIQIQIPKSDASIYYLVNELQNKVSSKPQAFLPSEEVAKNRDHRIFDFELEPGMGGDYTVYAAYVVEGQNPMDDGFIVLRSNLVIRKTTLSDSSDIDLN